MKKTSGIINFLITSIASLLALSLLALVAANPGYFTRGEFFSYDKETETVTFLGETADLSYERVQHIAGYPLRSVKFIANFLPDALTMIIK